MIYNKNGIVIKKIKENKFQIAFNHELSHMHFNNIFIKCSKKIKPQKKKITKHKIEVEVEVSNILSLKAYVKKNKEFLTYYQLMALYLDIGNQIKCLEKMHGKTMYLLSMDDIYVIEPIYEENVPIKEPYMFLVNFSNLVDIDKETQMIEINRSFQSNLFSSPELTLIKSFPTKIHSKSIYYSISMLCCHCIKTIPEQLNNTEELNQYLESALNNVYESKLYWAIRRCLHKIPSKRYHMII